MRIVTWNVNSLNARLGRVERWLQTFEPDVLCLQETKLADDAFPALAFEALGYESFHHGEGRWNGVAIASRVGIEAAVTNFGDGPVRESRSTKDAPNAEDFDPLTEARMVSAVCGGIRVTSLYAPTGREVDSPWYTGKLRWFDFEYAGLRHGAEDLAFLIGDEVWPIRPDEMLRITKDASPARDHVSYEAYLSLYTVFHAAQRLALVQEDLAEKGWISRRAIRKYDFVGAHPEFGLQLCQVGMFFADRSPLTRPLVRLFQDIEQDLARDLASNGHH